MLFLAASVYRFTLNFREIALNVSPGTTTYVALQPGGGGGVGPGVTGGGVPGNWRGHTGPAGMFVHGEFGIVSTCPMNNL